MKKYNKCGQNEMSALKLAMIITGSIVAAAGIILIIMRVCKKKHQHKVHDCCCGIDADEADSWDIDEDVLTELELDDEDSEEDESEVDTEETADEDNTVTE
jgi:hypothetical protein